MVLKEHWLFGIFHFDSGGKSKKVAMPEITHHWLPSWPHLLLPLVSGEPFFGWKYHVHIAFLSDPGPIIVYPCQWLTQQCHKTLSETNTMKKKTSQESKCNASISSTFWLVPFTNPALWGGLCDVKAVTSHGKRLLEFWIVDSVKAASGWVRSAFGNVKCLFRYSIYSELIGDMEEEKKKEPFLMFEWQLM